MPQAVKRQVSPTDVLWRYQLKRENAYLLERVNNLESAISKQGQRVNAIEKHPSSDAQAQGYSGLAQQVKELKGSVSFLERLERELRDKMEALHAETVTLQTQVPDLHAKMDEVKKDAWQREKTLVMRISDLESNVKKYQDSMKALRETVNQEQFESMDTALAKMKADARRDGTAMKNLTEKLKTLEKANELLAKAIERNNIKVADLATKRPAKGDEVPARTKKSRAPKQKVIPKPSAAASRTKRTSTAAMRVADDEEDSTQTPVMAQLQSHRKPPIANPKTPATGQKRTTKTTRRNVKPELEDESEDEDDSEDEEDEEDEDDDDDSDSDDSEDSDEDEFGDASVVFLVRKDGTTERPKGTACRLCARAHKRCTHGFSEEDLEAAQNRSAKTKKPPPKPMPKSTPASASKAKAQSEPKPRAKLDRNFTSDKPIVRQGKGWFEIEESPALDESDSESEDELANTDSASFPRRKRLSEADRLIHQQKALHIDLTEPDQPRSTRGVVPTQTIRTRRKRKAVDEAAGHARGRPRKKIKVERSEFSLSPEINNNRPSLLELSGFSFPVLLAQIEAEYARRAAAGNATARPPANNRSNEPSGTSKRQPIIQSDPLSAFDESDAE